MNDRWLSTEEIASYLGVTKDTIYACATSSNMPGHKVGKFWKFKQDDVDTWVKGGGAANANSRTASQKDSHD